MNGNDGVSGARLANPWRNPAFRVQFALFALVFAAIAGGAFLLADARSAAWAALAGVCGCVLFALFSAVRFSEIRRLSSEIESVLEEGRATLPSTYREGDVEILRNEVSKVVFQLSSAHARLAREKSALADALADITHQIRTPLTTVALMVPLIEQADVRERTRLLRELELMLDRISDLLSALLKIAKVDAGALHLEMREVFLARVIEEAQAPLAVPFDLHDVAFSRDVPAQASVRADGAWTAEALRNILKNCLEHTPAGGTVSVSVRDDAIATRMTVRDTGPGIPADDLPHVFERFYRGSGDRAASASDAACPVGFGIGLSLAQALLSAQGASLRASNAEEGGARFDISFPKMTV